MNQQVLHIHFQKRALGFQVTGQPLALEGGLLNHVWRVPTNQGSVIVKHAPPYIATQPEIALPCERAHFEAKALETLAKASWNHGVHIPRLFDYDAEANILVMQDAGPLPSLRQILADPTLSQEHAAQIGQDLGTFIGNLHKYSLNDKEYARRFHNVDIQRVRSQVQYHLSPAQLHPWTPRARHVSTQIQQLGNALLYPGHCMIMGDLWPQSILVAPSDIWIIDWELTHFGFQVQDVAHLLAHLWMLWDVAVHPKQRVNTISLAHHFRSAYEAICTQPLEQLSVAQRIPHAAAIHIGAEVLQRTVGSFVKGYVYESASDTTRKQVVQKMVPLIETGRFEFLGAFWEK
ncbi:MAG: phosphotransferase [Bacteroidota bacterium]